MAQHFDQKENGKINDMTTNERIKEIAQTYGTQYSNNSSFISFEEAIELLVTESTKDLSATIEAQKKEIAELDKDRVRLNELRNLIGYATQANNCTITLFEDDATYSIFLTVGREAFYGRSVREAIDSAISNKRNEL